jgi:hypothetical protein
MRRLSTLTFARRAAARLPDGQKLLAALNRPQVTDILETLDRHEHGLFFILGPFQVVKSLIGQCHLARNHWIHPVKAGWYGPTDKFQGEFYRGKLERLLEASPDLELCKFTKVAPPFPRGKPPFDTHKYTIGRHTYTEDGTHQLLSATTEGDRTGRTLQHIYLDEVHLWQHGWIKQIENRRGDFTETQNWKEIIMSTGLTRGEALGGEATTYWDITDQRTWHVRCPACHKFSEDRFLHREKEDDRESPLTGGYFYDRRFLENGLPDHAAIGASLRWVCPRCSVPAPGQRRHSPRCELPDTPASRELLSGTAEKPRGLYVAKNAHPYPAHRGWNFTALSVRSWIDIVVNFEKAQLARERGDLEPLAKVVREDFAGVWSPVEFLKTQSFTLQGGYKMGAFPGDHTPWPEMLRDPAGKPYAFCKVDVQQGWFRVVCRGWGPGSLSRLLWADTATSPGRIKEICDALSIIPDRVVLDRRYNKTYVRQIAGQFGWRTFFGEDDKDYLHPDGVRRVISPPMPMDPFNGTIHAGRYKIQEHKFAKWTCLDRLKLLRTLQNRAGQKLFTAADDAPDWYFKEMEAYVWIPKVLNGEPTGEWRVSGPDHSPDAECMGIAAASAHNLTGAESLVTAPTDQPDRNLSTQSSQS